MTDNTSMTLASDYDGTLAEHGRVPAQTIAALRRFRDKENKLILVTGRELDDLMSVFPEYELFHLIVAENGALLYDPASKHEELLAEPPPAEFVNALRARHVMPLAVGRIIVATDVSYESLIRKTMAKFDLTFDLIANLDSIMVLPRGINKGFGFRAAVQRLGITREDTIAVGDAENDIDLLNAARTPVAVANAISELKARAAWVTTRPAGYGVIELIEHALQDGLVKNRTPIDSEP